MLRRSRFPPREPSVKIGVAVLQQALEPVKLLAEVKHLADRALRMDFAGIRVGLKAVVPEFSQSVESYDTPMAVGGER